MKKTIWVAIAVLAIVIGFVLYNIFTNGYLFLGGGWEDSPEKALQAEAADAVEIEDDDEFSDEKLLGVKTLLDVIYFEESADVIYISEADTFTVVTTVYNKRKEQWHYFGMDYEENISQPGMIYSGDPEQLFYDYQQNYDKTILYGFAFSDSNLPSINGIKPQFKTYEFEIDGREYSVNYWWISGLDPKKDYKVDY